MSDESAKRQSTYDLISNLVLELSSVHSFHQSVFKSEENIAKMQQISGSLFVLIQRSLQHDIIRLICALTDSAGKGERSNVTISRMITELAPIDSDCRDRCQSILDDINDPLVAIRTHRDKRLVHFDFKTRVFRNETLPRMLVGHIDSVVDGICRIMEEASPAITNMTTSFHDIIQPEAPSASLIGMINRSLRFRKLWALAMDESIGDRSLGRLVREHFDRNV